MLRNGLYEQVINKALEGELATTDKLVETAPIDGGESSKVLSKYIAEIIEKGLDNVAEGHLLIRWSLSIKSLRQL